MNDRFLTLSAPVGPVEIKEKSSRFLSYAAPAPSLEEAERIVAALRKKYHDATHVCWASRFGDGAEKHFRYSDDGEPSGTAGLPIYQEIARRELFQTVVASVRYFGGVKLGTGGLTRTYGASAAAALDAALIREIVIVEPVIFFAPFELVGVVLRLAGKVENAAVLSQDYSETGVQVTLEVPPSRIADLADDIREKSAGRIRRVMPEN